MSKGASRRLASIVGTTGYVVAFTVRLLPHPWNVTPLGAATALTAAHCGFVGGLVGLLATMAVSDLLLWFTRYRAMGFPLVSGVTPFVYLGLVGYAVAGRYLVRWRPVLGPAAALVAASTWFFLVSNFGVWLNGMYPRTAGGLVACYVAALPFWRDMLLGDLLYGALLFGGYRLLAWRVAPASAVNKP